MAAYCFMSTEKVKSLGAFTRKMNHNYRLTKVPNADPSREHLNKELIKMDYDSYTDAFKDIMKKNNHTPRSNAVMGIEVVMSYNPREVEKDFDIEKWQEENVKWLKEKFGEENVISAVLHRDEGPVNTDAPDGETNACHIHAMVIPMKDGKLNAKSYIGGKAKLIQLQSSYGEAMKPLGLKRGLEGSVAKHEDIRKYYDELNKTLAKSLPEIEPGENVKTYRDRANKIYQNSNIHHMDEIKKMERKIVEAKTMARSISIDDQISMQNKLIENEKEKEKLLKDRAKLEREKKEFEQQQETIKNEYIKIKNFDRIVNGLKNYPDKEYSGQLADEINKLIRWENELEKAEAKSITDEALKESPHIGTNSNKNETEEDK